MRKEQGFTLPELLVVVAIIMLMTGLVLPNWRSGDRGLALERASHKAGQDVRRAQELALRAQSYTCPTGSISGYGIFFDQNTPDSYLLFAECNASNSYDAGVDGVIENISLEAGVEIQGVTPSPQASVVFIPPIPTVFIKPGDPLQAQVVLRRADGGAARTMTVTNKGIIDVD